MYLINIGHDLRYEVECAAMLFFPGEQLITTDDLDKMDAGDYILTVLEEEGDSVFLFAGVYVNGQKGQKYRVIGPEIRDKHDECERLLAYMMAELLEPITGIKPGWGILTGVRPVKLFHRRLDRGMSPEETAREFSQRFRVSEQKIDLALRTAALEGPILKETNWNEYSLYVSIPFCPSRCHYCSFVSQSIASSRAKELIPQYVPLLCEELRRTGEIMKEAGLRLSTVYFGGGTPTTLTAEQLDAVCQAVDENFDRSACREYTVEAGRPDTIDREKLLVLKKHGVGRISINPQTFNDAVLRGVGRKHTAQDCIDAYYLAREVGFDCINMDLIAGLPGDTVESFQHTIEQVIALAPENVTVHTLSIKRSADYGGDTAKARENAQSVESMVNYAQQRLLQEGWNPYYLYKQRNTLGNLENVGYCKPGFESRYNIYIMDETHSIAACGGGGVSKLINRSNGNLSRVANYKYPFEYVSRFDEILRRKEKVRRFFEEDHALPLRKDTER